MDEASPVFRNRISYRRTCKDIKCKLNKATQYVLISLHFLLDDIFKKMYKL